MTDALCATIADLRKNMNVLPKISHGAGCMMDQHRRYRAAAARLGQHLVETHAARITDQPGVTRITMHSISASSAGGMYGAFANWIAAAERRLAANKETTP